MAFVECRQKPLAATVQTKALEGLWRRKEFEHNTEPNQMGAGKKAGEDFWKLKFRSTFLVVRFFWEHVA